jgi:hypothetical protein
MVETELRFAVNSLTAAENKMNEGDGRHRPLPLGKGTKTLYESLKTVTLDLPELY